MPIATHYYGLETSKKIIIFGTGSLAAKYLFEIFGNLNIHTGVVRIAYFCDNNPQKWGTEFFGHPVCSPEKLREENPENVVVLVASQFTDEILPILHDAGITNIVRDFHTEWEQNIKFSRDRYTFLKQSYARLNDVSALFSDKKSKDVLWSLTSHYAAAEMQFNDIYEEPQYFNEIFAENMRPDEVFIDAGAFNGVTVLDFIRYAGGKYKKIYSFEPDPENFEIVRGNLTGPGRDKIELINKGVSSFNGQARFDSGKGGGSNINPHSDFKIDVVKLDDVITEGATFIKMDVEGHEYNALLGATRIIRTYKPKLAICAYHRHSDLIELPLLLKSMVPEYKLYLRHHTPTNNETVLYAKLQ